MRSELEPLLGKPVMVIGHVSSERNTGGLFWVCCSKPKIYQWHRHKSRNEMEAQQRPIRTDHIWIKAKLDHQTGKLEDDLYRECRFYGYIQRYTRKDGSEDIGLRWVRIATESFAHEIVDLRRAGKWESLKRNINECRENGALEFLADKRHTPAEMEAQLMKYYREAELMLARKPKPKAERKPKPKFPFL